MPQQSDELRLLRHIADLRFEEELRGYSKSQVDRVLQKLAPLADEFDELHKKLAEAETRVASAEARLLERSGSENDVIAPPAPAAAPEPSAAPVVAEAQAEAVPAHTAAAASDGGDEAPLATPADFDETLRKTLVLAQRTADETVKEAYDEADRITNNAHSEADLVLGKARTEAEELESATEQRRLELQAELDAEHGQRLTEIEAATEARRVELETALIEAEGSERADLLEQISDLQQLRGTLTVDIEHLENHLASRRQIIQSALNEVASVLDDPDALRSDATPELSVIEPVSAGDYTDVGIDVDAQLPAGESAAEPATETSAVDDGGAEHADPEPHADANAADQDITADGADVDAEEADLPDLPQRRSAATLAADDDESTEGSHLDDEGMISIAEAIPSIDDHDPAGPATEAAGPATEEYSFADLKADVHDDDDLTDDPAAPSLLVESPPSVDPAVAAPPADHTADPWDDGLSVATEEATTEASMDRPAWLDTVPDAVGDDPPPPPPPGGTQDPFLDQLRKATSEEQAGSDEALDRFLEGDQEDGERRPWFGRRR